MNFLGINSIELVGCEQTVTIEACAAIDSIKVQRFIVTEPQAWLISSIKIGERELIIGEQPISAASLVGNHPLFLEADCPRGTLVKVIAQNMWGVAIRFDGVMSGPPLEQVRK